MCNKVTIQVNDVDTELESSSGKPVTLEDFVLQAKMNGRFLILVNNQIVIKTAYKTTLLKNGDRVDVMTPISGG